MANTSAQILNYLGTRADLNYAIQQQIYWADKYEANQKRLNQQTKLEEKWNKHYDDAMDVDKEIKGVKDKGVAMCECDAVDYADSKVTQYDEALKEELAELDIEYDTLQALWETEAQNLRTRADAEKQSVATAAQDTCSLN